MVNMQNLVSQVLMSKQPMQALTNLLSPQQKLIFNQISAQPSEQQATEIAKMCNEKGITKEQLANMMQMINGNKR